MAKGHEGRGLSIRYAGPGAEIDNIRRHDRPGPGLMLNFCKRGFRFCETCKRHMEKRGLAVKGWQCDECKKGAKP